MQLVEDTPTVSSPWQALQRARLQNEWPSGSEPCLTTNGNQTFCRYENFARLVVPGLSLSSTTTSSSILARHDKSISLEPANTPSNDEASGDCSIGVAGSCDGKCTVFEKDYFHLFSWN